MVPFVRESYARPVTSEQQPAGPGGSTFTDTHDSIAPRSGEASHRPGELLGRMTARIAANLELEAVLEHLVDEAMAAFGAQRAMVSLAGQRGFTTAVRRGVSDAWARSTAQVREHSLSHVAFERHRVIASVNPAEDARDSDMRDAVLAEGIASAAIAPLIASGEAVGLLALYHDEPRAYDEGELATLLAVADYAAMAIRHARDFGQLSKWTRQLEAIQALGARLGGLRTVAEIGGAIVAELSAVISSQGLRVYRIIGEDVVPVALHGEAAYLDDNAEDLTCRLGVGITGWVAKHGVSQYLPDAAADPRSAHVSGTEAIDESMLLAPMVFDGRCLGVLVLSRLGIDQFGDDDLRLLTIFASFAAAAMANADLADQARRESEARLGAMMDSLRASEAKYRELVEHVPAVVYTADLGPDGAWHYISPRVEELLGYPADAWTSDSSFWLSRVHPDDRERLRLAEECRIGHAGEHGTADEYRLVHRNGEIRWVADEAMVVRPADGSPPHWSGFLTDITARKVLEARLQHQAFHDPLTGLANRALFADRVAHALARPDARHERLAVLFLDLDDFKTVNDGMGHEAGDALLIAVAQAIEGCLRPGDTAARLGGDEFGVLVEDLSSGRAAAAVADRIQAAVRRPFMILGREIVTSASIGIARPGPRREQAAQLLRNADSAMYAAKNKGKGRCESFVPRMHAAAVQRLELVGEIRRALENGEFELHYQPTIALGSGAIAGFEALLRWNHPSRGLVLPGHFISTAEETGQIIGLGDFVLGEACRQARTWQERVSGGTAVPVSVNVSARQFRHPALARTVAAALATAGLAPSALALEITESVVMEDSRQAYRRLQELREVGVRLAIDDFGTGYSSLSYLRRLPVDILKIDRAFIDGIGQGSDALALAGAIVRIGRTLRLVTIAEGVELPSQAATLARIGCDLAQGYHFARPMAASDALDYLRGDTRPLAG